MIKKWREEELRKASSAAVDHFVKFRLSEDAREYEEQLDKALADVKELFSETDDLLSLDADFFERRPDLLDAHSNLKHPVTL